MWPLTWVLTLWQQRFVYYCLCCVLVCSFPPQPWSQRASPWKRASTSRMGPSVKNETGVNKHFTLWALNIPYKNPFVGRLVNWKLWRRLPSNWGLVAMPSITANYGGQEKLVFPPSSDYCVPFFPQNQMSVHGADITIRTQQEKLMEEISCSSFLLEVCGASVCFLLE